MQTRERHYAILGLVGEGGQGKVYRARLVEGSFEKDVAIKLLHASPDADLLADLHEEARVQALLRDRAVVNVEPPLKLDGNWAMVMEFVDGMSLREACSLYGTLPPSVALEVIAEVARVLDKAWDMPDLDGSPLHLQHCDIKPANIQITPSGEVRVLDFGAAQRAIGSASNSATTISGTPGYVAPERLDGELTPTTDIYSLGVTLWKLLTGTRGRFQSERDIQDAIDQVGGEDQALRSALQLAVSMRDPYAGRRPTPAEVRAAALGLLRTMRGPDLGEWSQSMGHREMVEDEMTGVKLVTRESTQPVAPRAAPAMGPSKSTWMGLALGLFVVLVIVGGLFLGAGSMGVFRWMSAGGDPTERVAPAGSQLLTIDSHPTGAQVWMDGVLVGATPILEMVVRDGPYTMKLAKGRFETSRKVEVGAEQPHLYHWEITRGDDGLTAR